MHTARLDVSGVPPQGGYVAKQCPVRPQWDVLRPAEPAGISDAQRRRFEQGNRFEAEVFAELVALHPAAVVVERGGPDDRGARETATLEAMRAGAPLIVGGRLPVDEDGRRVGEPDVLVAAAAGGYHPVDVKHHGTLVRPRGSTWIEPVVSPLTAPWWHEAAPVEPEPAVDDDGEPEVVAAAKRKDDLLQLAHYRRMLEACGHAAAENVGGIIGTDGVVTWYDLEQPIWQTPSVSEGTKVRSTMDVYDFEFGFRLDIIATAQAHAEDPAVPLLVVPVRIGECASCPWWEHCRGLLDERHDVSLLPRFGWNRWKRHREHGTTTLEELAGLDHRTALLRDQGVDLVHLLDSLEGTDPQTPIAEVIGSRKTTQLANLDAVGISTAGDAARLDPRVVAYGGDNVGRLAVSIDQARARLDDAPALLARGVSGVEVPRGDVEVDLDLESTEDGVYCWGVLVTDRGGTALAPEGYRAFVSWEPLDEPTEVAVFEELMDWLVDLRRRAHESGRTICVYCFNDRAEAGELRRLAASPAASPGRVEEVEELVTSGDWVDLLRVALDHLVTGGSMGLKHLAPLGGFAWEDEDPGGEQSMWWHDLAVESADPDERAANRHRLLTYNRNDVEATLALREWLCDEAGALPRLDDTDAAWGW